MELLGVLLLIAVAFVQFGIPIIIGLWSRTYFIAFIFSATAGFILFGGLLIARYYTGDFYAKAYVSARGGLELLSGTTGFVILTSIAYGIKALIKIVKRSSSVGEPDKVLSGGVSGEAPMDIDFPGQSKEPPTGTVVSGGLVGHRPYTVFSDGKVVYESVSWGDMVFATEKAFRDWLDGRKKSPVEGRQKPVGAVAGWLVAVVLIGGSALGIWFFLWPAVVASVGERYKLVISSDRWQCAAACGADSECAASQYDPTTKRCDLYRWR